MTAKTTTPDTLLTVDLCNLGLEQAIEIEKASLATLVSLSVYTIDLSKSASLFSPLTFSPLAGDFFDVATKAYASFLDLQMHWLGLLMPNAGKAAASVSRSRLRTKPVEAKAEPLESVMDVVLGTPAGGEA